MLTVYDAIVILSTAFPELTCEEARKAIKKLHEKGIIKEELPAEKE